MNVSNINSYTNSLYLFNQLNDGLSNFTTSQNSSGKNSSSKENASYTSLSDQIASLIRLTKYAMDSMGLSDDSRVTFTKLKDYCDQVEERFTSAVTNGLESAAVDHAKVTYTLTGDGRLLANSSSEWHRALAQLAITEHSESDRDAGGMSLPAQLKQILQQAEIDVSEDFSFSLDALGNITALGNSAQWQNAIDTNNVSFSVLAGNIASVHIDPNVNFTLKLDENDTVSVNTTDGKYSEVLQAFFNENPSIVADYKRSEALSKIEDIRKFMNISLRESRTRLQIESLASFWNTTNNTSSFGNYSNGKYSLLSGINVSV